MLNRITLQGRLTKDPELRYTTSGKPVTSITLAVDRDRIVGETRETDFIDCVTWNGTAEFVSKYFRKGQMVCLSGRLQSRKWTDRDGNNRINWEVSADNVYFCGDNRERPNQAPVDASADKFTELDGDDGEIPF